MSDLRARRRRRTTDAIRQACVTLVYEHGLDNVTTEMISAEAGISPRTFFNYFPYKEAALVPPSPEFSDEAVERFVNGAGPLLEDLAELMVSLFVHFDGAREVMRKMFEISRSHPKLLALKVNVFHEFDSEVTSIVARRLGVLPNDESSELIAALATSAVRVGWGRWVSSDSGCASDYVTRSFQTLRTVFDS